MTRSRTRSRPMGLDAGWRDGRRRRARYVDGLVNNAWRHVRRIVDNGLPTPPPRSGPGVPAKGLAGTLRGGRRLCGGAGAGGGAGPACRRRHDARGFARRRGRGRQGVGRERGACGGGAVPVSSVSREPDGRRGTDGRSEREANGQRARGRLGRTGVEHPTDPIAAVKQQVMPAGCEPQHLNLAGLAGRRGVPSRRHIGWGTRFPEIAPESPGTQGVAADCRDRPQRGRVRRRRRTPLDVRSPSGRPEDAPATDD